MFALVELVVRVNHSKGRSERVMGDMKPEDFWNWSYFVDYLQFIVLFWIVTAFITFIFLNSRKSDFFRFLLIDIFSDLLLCTWISCSRNGSTSCHATIMEKLSEQIK